MRDAECFRWCVLAKIHPVQERHRKPERLHHYRPFYNDVNFGKLKSENFKITDIPKFEKLNPELSFTVVTVTGNKNFSPVYSSYEEAETHVTLLYYAKKKKSHYALVRSLDTLLYSTTGAHCAKYFCKFCFNKFPEAAKRDAHERLCRENGTQKTRLPPEGSKICFDSKLYSKCQRSEYVAYFDFETYMEEVEEGEEAAGKKTRKTMRHIPFCYAIIVTDHEGNLAYGPFTYAADGGVVEHFINKVLEIEDFLYKHKKNYPANISQAQYEQFDRTSACDLCGERFTNPAEKIIDHEHYIEKDNYRSALHGYGPDDKKVCNALRRRSNMLTFVGHNTAKYDSILIWKGAVEHPALADREIKVIPRTKSTYLCFSIHLDDGRGVVFIDSMRHVMSSLDSVARTLAPEDMRVVRAYFKDDAKFALMTRKGLYPYEFVRRYEQFQDDRLPPIQDFYSSLSDETISQDEWEHANNVFQTFECKNLLEYAVLYCICDTGLLCDIFSSYRRTTYDVFQLEAAKFVSGASLSWACALRKTRLKIDLITDCDHFSFAERAIRGGQAFISSRYLKANNEHCDDYDPTQPKTWLSVLDLTSLYTGAMGMRLPCGEYAWVDADQFHLNVTEDDEYCCYWEVDLEYDPSLHLEHRDFPLAPEKLHITEEMLSPTQRRLLAVADQGAWRLDRAHHLIPIELSVQLPVRMSADKTYQKYIIITPAQLKRLRGEGSIVPKLDAEREATLEKAAGPRAGYDDFLKYQRALQNSSCSSSGGGGGGGSSRYERAFKVFTCSAADPTHARSHSLSAPHSESPRTSVKEEKDGRPFSQATQGDDAKELVKLWTALVDLADVQGLAKYNDSVRYLIVAVEAASRAIYVEPLQDKSAREVVRGMKNIFAKLPEKVTVVRSDRGAEWKSSAYLKLLRDNGMRAQYASNESHAALSERSIKTVFGRLFRFMTYGNTSTYLPALQKIVSGINGTPHAYTGVAPSAYDPRVHLYPTWERTVLKHRPAFAKEMGKKYKFQIGDRVRVSLSHDAMSKGYAGYYSRAYFFVTARSPGPPKTYRIANIENEPVAGEFYQEELQLVRDREDQSYPVDSVHSKRTVRGVKEALVSFKGWPRNHRVWIPASAIQNTVSEKR
ncbi:hypothetical protein FOCC_FOCC017001 [Frankliniella occidentalis]|nr:hypothetical protein FOCC_FOCC017001 [Frankliniella occidentalis]